MRLWLLSQDQHGGYDTYDSVVVAAETEEEAKSIHPSAYCQDRVRWTSRDWASSPNKVKAKLLGVAAPGIVAGVILASFNAG